MLSIGTHLCDEMVAIVSLPLHGTTNRGNGKTETDDWIVRAIIICVEQIDWNAISESLLTFRVVEPTQCTLVTLRSQTDLTIEGDDDRVLFRG